MKITLISTGSESDLGPKRISKFLKNHGHEVEIFFSNNLLELECKNSDLIVVSANLKTSKKASEIINKLKSLNKPIAYAGIYPNLYPEEAVKETDLVIINNPEETILELANRLQNFQKISDIPYLWFKATEKELIKN